MGRAYQNRKESMAKTAAAKTKTYSKYGREVYMCAKAGGLDPAGNLLLRSLIDRAKKDQVPSHVIERAIDKARGGGGEDSQSKREVANQRVNELARHSRCVIDHFQSGDSLSHTLAVSHTVLNRTEGRRPKNSQGRPDGLSEKENRHGHQQIDGLGQKAIVDQGLSGPHEYA